MLQIDEHKTLGIIANPMSSRDVRRVVSSATTITAVERANILERILLVLGGLGLKQAVMMPDTSGLSGQLLRNLRSRARVSQVPLPGLEFLDMNVTASSRDSRTAAAMMHQRSVDAIVVLGGDGTHRDVASASGQIPLACISTGTNNAFPEFHEATMVGMALGVALSNTHAAHAVVEPNKRLVVLEDGEPLDRALVDLAVTREQWIGSRAIWDPASLERILLTFCEPTGLGMSSIGSASEAVSRRAPHGLDIHLAEPAAANRRVLVPLTPGRLFEVGIDQTQRFLPDETRALPAHGVLALDGEREIECRPDRDYAVHLDFQGPRTLNIPGTMTAASQCRLFSNQPTYALREVDASKTTTTTS